MTTSYIKPIQPISLISMLITLFTITGVFSCNYCRNAGADQSNKSNQTNESKVALGASRTQLQGLDKTVELKFIYQEEENKGAKQGNFKLVMSVSGTHPGKLTYQVNGVNKEIEAGEENEEQLNNLWGAKPDAILEKNKPQAASFTFEPASGTEAMTVIFQLIHTTNGNEVVSEIPVTWQAVPVNSFELSIEGLERNREIKNTNKFKIKISKMGSQIAISELPGLEVHVAKNPATSAATLKDIVTDVIKFEKKDFISGVIEKEIEAIPDTTDTTFSLQLKYRGKDIGNSEQAICRKVIAGNYSLSLNKTAIDDGEFQLKITVWKGTEILQTSELEKLQLVIKRTVGRSALLAGIGNGKLQFNNRLALDIAVDNKSAYKDLTISPGTDKEAAFEVGLLDPQGKAIARTQQIIIWNNEAKLEFTGVANYDPIAETVTVEIKNSGKIKLEDNKAALSWHTGSNAIVIEGNKTGYKNLPTIEVGANYSVTLHDVVCMDSTSSRLELAIAWDKLKDGRIVKDDIVLARDSRIAQALQGQAQTEAGLEKIKALSQNTPPDFLSANDTFIKVKEGLIKAKNAQTALASTGAINNPTINIAVQQAEETVKKVEAIYIDMLKAKEKEIDSIPLGHKTLGTYNQQNHPSAKQHHAVGNGACTCMVGTLLKAIQDNSQLDLHHHPEEIDTILGNGIKFYTQTFSNDAKNGYATDIELTLQKLGLHQDPNTLIDQGIGWLQPEMLTSEAAIQQEINKFSDTSKLAVVKVGPEVWGLMSHGNGTFDLFDSHGRQELNAGNAAAFIQRTNSQMISGHIWNYSPLKDFTITEIDQLGEAQQQNGYAYIYWLN